MMPNQRICIDTCYLLDAARSERLGLTPDVNSDVWYISRLFEAAKNGDLTIMFSEIAIVECLYIRVKGQEVFDKATQAIFDNVLMSGKDGILAIQISRFVLDTARNLKWKHGIRLKPLDSIHVASAIETGCSEFLTNNGRITRATSELNRLGLSVIKPSDTQCLPSQYRQMRMISKTK